MNNIEIGIKVNDQQAITSVNKIEKEVKKLGDTTKKTARDTKDSKFFEGAQRSIADMQGGVGGLGSIMDRLSTSFKTGAGAAGSLGVAIGAVMSGMYALTSSVSKFVDDMDESAQKMGVSIEFYQKLQATALKTGADIGSLTTAMRTVTNTAVDAANGNDTMAKKYEMLGVSIRDANGNIKDQQTLFSETAIALAGVQNKTERAAIANDLLGRSATELAPLFNEGKDAVRGYLKENENAVVVSQRMANAGSKFNDTIQNIGNIFKKVMMESLTPFIEMMGDVMASFSDEEIKRFAQSIALVAGWILKAGALIGVGFNAIVGGINFFINEAVRVIYDRIGALFGWVGDRLQDIQTILSLVTNADFLNKPIQSLKGMSNEMKTAASYAEEMRDAELEGANNRQESILKYVQGLGEVKDITKEIETNTGNTTTNTTASAEAAKKYAEALKNAQSIAQKEREDALSQTLEGRISLIEQVRDEEIKAINAVKDKDINKVQALEDIRLNSERKIAEEHKKYADEISQKEKENLDKHIEDMKKGYSDAIKTLDIFQEYAKSPANNIFTALFDPSFDKVRSETLSKIIEYKAELVTAENDLKDPANANNEILKTRIDLLESLIFNTEKYIGISEKNPYGTIQSEAGATAKNADLLSRSKKPAWMTQQVKFGYYESNYPKLVDMTFGDKIKEEWDKADVGTRFSTITEQSTAMTESVISNISSIVDYQVQADLKMAESNRKREQDRINSLRVSERKKKILTDAADKELEQKQKDAQKRQLKMQLAQVWASTAMGIAGAWAQAFATNAPMWAPVIAGISTALLLANAGVQTGIISKQMEGLATGGIVGQGGGASMGADNTTIKARNGEMVLNADQQAKLWKRINSEPTNTGNITVQIMGNVDSDSRAKEIEDTLYTLQSNGRLAQFL